MENLEGFSVGKEAEGIEKFAKAYFELRVQINNPTREGMIKALLDAKNIAPQEISMLENSQGEIYPTSSDNFELRDLYRKLTQYQQGLYIHAVKKFGEEKFKKQVEDCAKNNFKVWPNWS